MTAARRPMSFLLVAKRQKKWVVVKKLLSARDGRRSNPVSYVKNNSLSFPVVVSKEKNLTHALPLGVKSAMSVVLIQFPTILILRQSIGR
jgi:hypothetical protein